MEKIDRLQLGIIALGVGSVDLRFGVPERLLVKSWVKTCAITIAARRWRRRSKSIPASLRCTSRAGAAVGSSTWFHLTAGMLLTAGKCFGMLWSVIGGALSPASTMTSGPDGCDPTAVRAAPSHRPSEGLPIRARLVGRSAPNACAPHAPAIATVVSDHSPLHLLLLAGQLNPRVLLGEALQLSTVVFVASRRRAA
jgi:hypothetical protein